MIILKTVIIYFLTAFLFRIMGKRELGQLGTFDLVVFLLIAELVAMSIEHSGKFIKFLIPILILTLLQILISKLSLKSSKFRNIVDGKPVVIIKKGIINFKSMVEQNYTLDDLLLQLREKDIRSIDEVDYAILEINGKLSVFKKDDKDNKVFPLPIILDGKVVFENLKLLNKSKDWLLNILIDKKISASDVFYAFCKENELYIIKRDDTKKI